MPQSDLVFTSETYLVNIPTNPGTESAGSGTTLQPRNYRSNQFLMRLVSQNPSYLLILPELNVPREKTSKSASSQWVSPETAPPSAFIITQDPELHHGTKKFTFTLLISWLPYQKHLETDLEFEKLVILRHGHVSILPRQNIYLTHPILSQLKMSLCFTNSNYTDKGLSFLCWPLE